MTRPRSAPRPESGRPRGEPVEVELRFIVAGGFPDCGTLQRLRPGGMRLVQYGDSRLHSNVYLDTRTLGLRTAGANLRVRTGACGRRWVTLKQKTRGGHRGALNVRLEFEVELEQRARPQDSTPWRRARALYGPRNPPHSAGGNAER